MRSAGIYVGLALGSLSACIAGDKRRATTDSSDSDATTTDTAVGSDTGVSDGASGGDATVDDTTAPPDDTGVISSDGSVGDDGVVSSDADATGPTCQTDEECVVFAVAVPSGCSRSWCDGGHCRNDTWAEGEPCDDGDACTVGDRCGAAICTGEDVVCDELACKQSLGCDPVDGCVYEPVEANTACDDGDGVPADECVDGWYGPEDACDGFGTCVGGAFSPPGGGFPLQGDWYTVISSALPGAFDTLRGRLSISSAGELTVSEAQSSAAIWAGGMNGVGFACAAPNGQVHLGRTAYNYAGNLGGDEDVLVFGGLQAGELGLAVRPDGKPEDVTGTYLMISTASVQSGANPWQLVTWVGSLHFEAGCVVDRTSATTTPGVPNSQTFWFADTEGACLLQPTDLVSLPLHLLPNETASPANEGIDIMWRGAIAQGGDLLLLTRDAPNTTAPLYGTIILMRDGGPGTRDSVVTTWAMLSQRGGASAASLVDNTPFVEWGVLTLPDPGPSPIVGWIGAPFKSEVQAVNDGWFFLSGTSPRYSHRLVLDGETVHQTGWVAAKKGLIAGWVAPPVGVGITPRDLGSLPVEGSLFVMTKPARWDQAQGL